MEPERPDQDRPFAADLLDAFAVHARPVVQPLNCREMRRAVNHAEEDRRLVLLVQVPSVNCAAYRPFCVFGRHSSLTALLELSLSPEAP